MPCPAALKYFGSFMKINIELDMNSNEDRFAFDVISKSRKADVLLIERHEVKEVLSTIRMVTSGEVVRSEYFRSIESSRKILERIVTNG